MISLQLSGPLGLSLSLSIYLALSLSVSLRKDVRGLSKTQLATRASRTTNVLQVKSSPDLQYTSADNFGISRTPQAIKLESSKWLSLRGSSWRAGRNQTRGKDFNLQETPARNMPSLLLCFCITLIQQKSREDLRINFMGTLRKQPLQILGGNLGGNSCQPNLPTKRESQAKPQLTVLVYLFPAKHTCTRCQKETKLMRETFLT